MTKTIPLLLCAAILTPAGAAPVVAAGVRAFAGPAVSSKALQQPADGAALRAAASRGDLATVTALLEAGVAVDDANEYGATPLILATMNAHVEVVRALLAAGADAQRADTFYRRTPLQWAAQAGSDEISSMLFVAGAGDFNALFLETVRGGDLDEINQLLAIQTPPEEVLTEALQHALATRNVQLGELLVSAGATMAAPETVSIDPARLRLYEGRYVDETGYELVIIADPQTLALLVRPPGTSNPLRFVPVEESTFIAEQTPNIYIRFTVRGGRIAGMSFTQPGVTREMSKQ